MNISLAELDATSASSQAHEFEYINPNGNATGLFFSVLGSQSEIVSSKTNQMINERRRKAASREVNSRIGVGRKAVEFDMVESDIEFGQSLAAARLVGWRGPNDIKGLSPEQLARFQGITDQFSPENALRLCKSNRDIAAAITLQSDEVGNFIAI